jgi:hypothetical protein
MIVTPIFPVATVPSCRALGSVVYILKIPIFDGMRFTPQHREFVRHSERFAGFLSNHYLFGAYS